MANEMDEDNGSFGSFLFATILFSGMAYGAYWYYINYVRAPLDPTLVDSPGDALTALPTITSGGVSQTSYGYYSPAQITAAQQTETQYLKQNMPTR